MIPRRGLSIRTAVFVFAMMLFWGSSACAAEESLIEVAQPMAAEEESPEVYHVTCQTYFDTPIAGWAIDFTCDPNAVVVEHRRSDLTPGAENRNLASLNGLRIRVVHRPYYGEYTFVEHPAGDRTRDDDLRSAKGFFVADTVEAVLEVPAHPDSLAKADLLRHVVYPEDTEAVATWLELVVDCTVKCVLENASKSDIPIRTLILHIDGPARYAKYAKTYTLWQPPPLPARKR